MTVKYLMLGCLLGVLMACQVSPTPPLASGPVKPAIFGFGVTPPDLTGLSPTARLDTLAGNGEADFADGQGSKAMFAYPWGITTDAQGNVLVADRFNHRLRKITPAGLVSTVAGNRQPAYRDGTASQALFDNPVGVVRDQREQFYVADPGNQVIRLWNSTGIVSALTAVFPDKQGGFVDGVVAQAKLNSPSSMALDGGGNLYIADTNNHRIRRIDADGKTITTVAGNGSKGWKDGTALQAQFHSPRALAFDHQGHLYITDGYNHCIRKLTPDGQVVTVAGNRQAGFKDGEAIHAQLNEPNGIAVDRNGNLYVADTTNHRIRLISPGGIVSTLVGTSPGFADGDKTQAKLSAPTGIALVTPGLIYIADSQNHRIRRLR